MQTALTQLLKVILVFTTLFVHGVSFDSPPAPTPMITLPQLVVAHTETENRPIKVLSYNVWGLPISLPGHDQSVRFRKLSDSLAYRNFDIVCLQEVFHRRVRKKLKEGLLNQYFHASDYDCNQNILGPIIQKDCQGGLMTLSKYPIISEQFFPFTESQNASVIEKIGAKGFLFTTIIRNGKPINIINTHLYSGSTQFAARERMHQVKEMQQLLNGMESYQKHPTFLCGDLNITHPDVVDLYPQFDNAAVYHYITDQLRFEDHSLPLDQRSYTINPEMNPYKPVDEPKQKLDYIMVHVPDHCGTKVCLDKQGIDFYGQSALSDHLGWKASIRIEESSEIAPELEDTYTSLN